MYQIKKYSYDQAKKYGVKIQPSQKANKKIDVIKNNKVIASIGDINYKDYPTYLQEDKKQAEQRRKLYKIRHKNDLKSGNGFWANKILW